MDKISHLSTTAAVTVTYGARWHLLRQTLQAARSEGIDCAVVVDNGASEPIATLAQNEFGAFVEVVTLGRNTGSAGGFKAGMQRALELHVDYIMLLDDDNQMQPGCLAALSEAYSEHARTVPRDALATLAYRSDRQEDAAAAIPASGMDDDRSAFFGFNVRDLPFKVFRRTAWGRRWIAGRSKVPQVAVAVAPYSGMYFHRSVLEAHGLPDERFVLYADDTDFSFRLTRAGGKIVLVTGAHIVDLELSWNVKARFSNTFDALLLGDGDFRAYYSTRNNADFECWPRDGGGWFRALNRAVYLGALSVRAVMKGRKERFDLLRSAIRDGEAGRLGQHPDYPI